ncbi:hypothetical protein D3C85_770120 [compost metagenome]
MVHALAGKRPVRHGVATGTKNAQAMLWLQCLRLFWRADALEQARRSAGHVVRLIERPGDQVGVIDRVDANGNVGARRNQVFRVVCLAQRHGQSGVLRGKGR